MKNSAIILILLMGMLGEPAPAHGGPTHSLHAPTSVSLTWINNAIGRQAVCNDGTPAGYYFAPGTGVGATVWIIHLQGGGFCYDLLSCQRRAQSLNAQTIMSSNGWPTVSVGSGNGLMSSDPLENPDFYNANRVYVRYCSSDVFSGATNPYPGNPWHFRGRTILRAVLDDLGNSALTPAPNLSAATTVLLSGGSAGGVAIFPNLDWVAEYLANQFGIHDVRGLSDAGWIVDIAPYDSNLPRFEEQAQSGYAYWRALGRIDHDCETAHAGQEWRCYIGQYVYPYLNTPLFIYNSQQDADSLVKMGVTYPYDAAELAYRQVYQTALVESLEPEFITPVFSPISEKHAIAIHPSFTELAVVSQTMQLMLGAWVFDRPGPTKVIEYQIHLPGLYNLDT